MATKNDDRNGENHKLENGGCNVKYKRMKEKLVTKTHEVIDCRQI